MSAAYPNVKVSALIDGHTSIDSTWTTHDFLALAALDQGGLSAADQSRVRALLPDLLPGDRVIAYVGRPGHAYTAKRGAVVRVCEDDVFVLLDGSPCAESFELDNVQGSAS